MSNTTNNKTEKWPAYEYKGEIVKLGYPGADHDHDPTNGWQPENWRRLRDYKNLKSRTGREERIKLYMRFLVEVEA